MSNANLQRAKKRKNDEFYTRFEDVEKELAHYPHAFEGKTVYCNCDDPFKSAFVKYFKLNFDRLKLNRLIATCFNGDAGKGETMFLFPRTDDRVAWHFEKTASSETCEKLQYNGDFRSEECVELLKQADVVVTNPPFSLFGKFFATLIEHGVDFIVLGHLTACVKQLVFPCLKCDRVQVTSTGVAMFNTPNGDGQSIPIAWYATANLVGEKPQIELTETYTPEKFPRYDNFDAIEVSKIAEIPCDYDGAMGVPVTFFASYNPSQFEIVGVARAFDDGGLVDADFLETDVERGRYFSPYIDGKSIYDRIFIKRKNFSCNCSNSLINSPQTERKNISKEKPTNQPKKNPEELDLNYDEP